MLEKRIEELFNISYMAHYDTFEAVVNSKDYHTAIGLGQLLEKLEFEGCSN